MNDELQKYAYPQCQFCNGRGIVEYDESESFDGFTPTYGPCICIDADEYEDDEDDMDDDDMIFADGKVDEDEINENLNIPIYE